MYVYINSVNKYVPSISVNDIYDRCIPIPTKPFVSHRTLFTPKSLSFPQKSHWNVSCFKELGKLLQLFCGPVLASILKTYWCDIHDFFFKFFFAIFGS